MRAGPISTRSSVACRLWPVACAFALCDNVAALHPNVCIKMCASGCSSEARVLDARRARTRASPTAAAQSVAQLPTIVC